MRKLGQHSTSMWNTNSNICSDLSFFFFLKNNNKRKHLCNYAFNTAKCLCKEILGLPKIGIRNNTINSISATEH